MLIVQYHLDRAIRLVGIARDEANLRIAIVRRSKRDDGEGVASARVLPSLLVGELAIKQTLLPSSVVV